MSNGPENWPLLLDEKLDQILDLITDSITIEAYRPPVGWQYLDSRAMPIYSNATMQLMVQWEWKRDYVWLMMRDPYGVPLFTKRLDIKWTLGDMPRP